MISCWEEYESTYFGYLISEYLINRNKLSDLLREGDKSKGKQPRIMYKVPELLFSEIKEVIFQRQSRSGLGNSHLIINT